MKDPEALRQLEELTLQVRRVAYALERVAAGGTQYWHVGAVCSACGCTITVVKNPKCPACGGTLPPA